MQKRKVKKSFFACTIIFLTLYDLVLMWLQEDVLSEGEMAQRRAFLLEKQQKRTEELKKRRQWHEQERDIR